MQYAEHHRLFERCEGSELCDLHGREDLDLAFGGSNAVLVARRA